MYRSSEEEVVRGKLSSTDEQSEELDELPSRISNANGIRRSFLHQSLTSSSAGGNLFHSGEIQAQDESDLNSTPEPTRPCSPPLSPYHNGLPTVPYNNRNDQKNSSKKSFPRKTWERHYRSFLSKSRSKNGNQNEYTETSNRSHPQLSSSNESSTRAGAAFRKIFKSTKNKMTKHSRTSSLTFNNSPSNSSLASSVSIDATLRRGKEKGSHSSLHSYLDTPPQDNISQTSSVSAEHASFSDQHHISQFYVAPNITGSTLLIPPLSKASNTNGSSSDLDVPLRGGSHRYSIDKRKYFDKDLRKSFTEFHSSNEYGKDSTHAFLGDNNSLHGASFISDMYKSDVRNGRRDFNFVMKQMDPFLHKSLPNQLYSSQHLPPVSEYEALNPSRVLFPIEGTGSWDHTGAEIDDNQLIGPAIMSLCPFHVLSMLNCDQQCDDTLSLHQFGRIILGTATVAQFGPLSNFGWVNAIFVLRQNYLLEYKCDRNNINEKPRGYAHLQHSTVRAHPEFPNALELVISDNNRIQKGKKVLLIKVESIEERERWVNSLEKAASLKIEDLYDFENEKNETDALSKKIELGKGRYSTIYATRRKIGPASSLELENESSEPVFPSDDEDYNPPDLDCAIKIISKSIFWGRVRERSERVDTLVRETAVHATLTAHSNRMRQSPPFLKLQNFFETRESVVLELELLDGKDLFQYIRSMGSLEESETALIMKDILECLSLAERLGIAHRDVKPANILMCNKRNNCARVKVGDFGMSTFVNVDGLIRGRCGTPGYVAPEIFRAGASVGYRNKVDVFSAGVTLYVLLCGYEPFYGETDAELMETNKAAKVEFLDSDWEHVSSEAKDLVRRMMEIDPDERISAEQALCHPWILNWVSLCQNTNEENNGLGVANNSCTIS